MTMSKYRPVADIEIRVFLVYRYGKIYVLLSTKVNKVNTDMPISGLCHPSVNIQLTIPKAVAVTPRVSEIVLYICTIRQHLPRKAIANHL